VAIRIAENSSNKQALNLLELTNGCTNNAQNFVNFETAHSI
jgi:hypothetical protein